MEKISFESIENIKTIEDSEAYLKVLHWFFSYPEKQFGLNELVKKLKISKTSASNLIEKLVKEGFLKRDIIGRSWRVSCNLKHRYNKFKKIGYNLDLVGEIFENIKERLPAYKAVILFGSYSKGDDNSESDIDLGVETFGERKYELIELGEIKKVGYRKNVKISLHFFSQGKIDSNLFSNISNGIIIDGFLEVKNG